MARKPTQHNAFADFFTRATPFIVFKKMELKGKKYKRILGIGDVHGCSRHLEKLLAAVQPTGDDLIITLGDYIDRGPGSKGVLDTLVRLHHDPGINIVSLRGNHDALMLMCLEGLAKASEYWPAVKSNDKIFERWCRLASHSPANLWWDNQAKATIFSYAKGKEGIEGRLQDLSEQYGKGLRDISEVVRSLTTELIPQEHIDFLRDTCVDAVETDRFIFVHGGLYPDPPLAGQPLFALHWNRFDRRWPPHVSGKKVVCGHTPQPDLLVHDLGHAVCLDTGAYMAKGFLSCMDVLTGQTWQIDDDLQMIQHPVVHYDNGVPYVRISELPKEEGERFRAWLMGHSAPFVEGEGDCAWPTDFNAWRCRRI